MQNNVYVFKEPPYLLGVTQDDFESHLPLNQAWISPEPNSSNIWRFKTKDRSPRKGFFVHPGALFGFQKVQISNTSVLFLKKLDNEIEIGILMNEFLLQTSNKKAGSKQLSVDFVKNFPEKLPKTAFHFVQRHKRKNVFVINFDGLMDEFTIVWPNYIEIE